MQQRLSADATAHDSGPGRTVDDQSAVDPAAAVDSAEIEPVSAGQTGLEPDASTADQTVDVEKPAAHEVGDSEAGTHEVDGQTFVVKLENFEGPFDLLLQLIAKHRLDVTEVALSQVTDEFIAHVRAQGSTWDLELTSNFLLVAATLLDLKAARLLPQGEVEDPEDLALLEARDLLFARLLQYRAFKEVSFWIAERLETESVRAPAPGGLEAQFASLLPEIQLRVTPEDLARIAAKAMAPRDVAEVSLTHLHGAQVSVVEESKLVVRRLREQRRISFADLVRDAADRLTAVCRFLALLELYRERAVSFVQPTPLGSLEVTWTGSDEGEVQVGEEFDDTPVSDAAPADHSSDVSSTQDSATQDSSGDDSSTDREGDQ